MADFIPNFDFIAEYAQALLEENGIKLNDEQKKVYVPQLMAQVETRLGMKLLPQLSDDQMDLFVSMMNVENTKPEEWQKFWTEAVPDFTEQVKDTLMEISAKAKEILANQ